MFKNLEILSCICFLSVFFIYFFRTDELEGVAQTSKLSPGISVSSDVNARLDPSLNWSDVEWLKSITTLPVVVKGILTGLVILEKPNL